MRTSHGLRAVAMALLLAVVAGCTDGAPEDTGSPTPESSAVPPAAAGDASGDRVTIIIGPPTHVAVAEAAALERGATALAAEPPEGVAEVRVVQAESAAFTFDLVDLAVDAGVDVVCIVGTGAAPLLVEAALTRREARFCGTDGRVEGGPVNISTVTVDPTALVVAGAAAIGRSPAPVGLLVSDVLGDPTQLTAAFTEAVATPTQPFPEPVPSPAPAAPGPAPTTSPATDADTDAAASAGSVFVPVPGPLAAPPPSPVPSPTPTPSASPSPSPSPAPSLAPSPAPLVAEFATVAVTGGQQSLARAAEDLAARAPSRSLLLATPGTDLVAPTVVAGGSSIVVVADWAVDAEGLLPAGLLAGLTVDWSVLLRRAVDAALDDESGQVQRLGLADQVIGALPGQIAGSAAAVERTFARIGEAEAEAAAAADAADAQKAETASDETDDG